MFRQESQRFAASVTCSLMSIKESFVGIYNKIKSIVIGAYVRVNNWLVDLATGEIVSDLNNMDVNQTFWDAVCRASINVVLGERAAHAETETTKKRVIGAVIRNITIGLDATGVATIATLFGATFIGAFWIAVITFYSVAFVSNLALELFKNHMLTQACGWGRLHFCKCSPTQTCGWGRSLRTLTYQTWCSDGRCFI